MINKKEAYIVEIKEVEDGFNSFMHKKHKKIEEIRQHTIRVVEMCETFSRVLELDDNEGEILIKAAWLHDIAKLDFSDVNGKDEHHKKEYIKKCAKECNLDIKDHSEIYGIIKAHKGKFDPPKNIALESAILRICDKLDKFNKRQGDASDKCIDSFNKIEKYYKYKLPDGFENTYDLLFHSLQQHQNILSMS